MHPSYKSDKPGIAPDCGMELVPVYEDGSMSGPGGAPAGSPPGTVQVSSEKQQLLGVQVGAVERSDKAHNLRVLGRVAADETKLYFINATVDGWITHAAPVSTGSLVKRNERLGSFYSPEFLSAQQALLFALGSKDRVQTTGRETPAQAGQVAQFNINIQQYRDTLKNLGMGDSQIDAMIRVREYSENIHIESPADGFILARNISPGLRFEKGRELFRIADLSRVWILADAYENEGQHLKPGAVVRASVPNQRRTFQARVSRFSRNSIRPPARSRSAWRPTTPGSSSVPTCSWTWRCR